MSEEWTLPLSGAMAEATKITYVDSDTGLLLINGLLSVGKEFLFADMHDEKKVVLPIDGRVRKDIELVLNAAVKAFKEGRRSTQ